MILSGSLGVVNGLTDSVETLWAVQIASLTCQLVLVRAVSNTLWQTLLSGSAFAAGWLFTGMSWLYEVAEDFSGAGGFTTFSAVTVILALLSIFMALAFSVFWKIQTQGRSALAFLVAFPVLWTALDYFRATLLLGGVPWLGFAYTQTSGPLIGVAPILGAFGVTILVTTLCSCLAMTFFANTKERVCLVTLALFLVFGSHAIGLIEWSEPQSSISVGLVQPNTSREQFRTMQSVSAVLQMYERTITKLDSDLIVLPELALPMEWEQLPASFRHRVKGTVESSSRVIVFGMPTADSADASQRLFQNAVLIVDAHGETVVYKKRILTPFGERPLTNMAILTTLLSLPPAVFSAGEEVQEPFRVGNHIVSPHICFEVMFGATVATSISRAAHSPTLLLSLSNYAWFDGTKAMRQQIAFAKMRAIETAKPIAISTNTGLSGTLDHRGKITLLLEPYVATSQATTITTRSGITPYSQWGNLPVLAYLSLGGLCVGMLAISVIKKSRWTTQRRQL